MKPPPSHWSAALIDTSVLETSNINNVKLWVGFWGIPGGEMVSCQVE